VKNNKSKQLEPCKKEEVNLHWLNELSNG